MEGKDNIKELFSQKLGNYEAPVNPELWTKISSQVAAGTAATTASTGLSLFAKVAIGIGVSVAAITTVVLLTSTPDDTVSEEPINEFKALEETPTSTTTDTEQVAEVSTENELNSTEYRDGRENLGNGSNETSVTSSNQTPTHQEATETPSSDHLINTIPMRNATPVKGDHPSEPTIVPGVTYGSWTNYGGAPNNAPDPEVLEESSTPKVAPIERFVNVFTPNGDGDNDEFFLVSEGLTDFSIVIFDSKGDIVFKSSDPAFRWDGRDMRTGRMVDSGNYMYMVSALDSEGEPYPIYERLTIKR